MPVSQLCRVLALLVAPTVPRPTCSDLLQHYQQCSSREEILMAQKKWLEDDTYKGPQRDLPPTSSDSDSGGEGEEGSDSTITKQMTVTKPSSSVLHV